MSEKKLVKIPRTTLDIYNYSENGFNIYEFDATECSPPEPMVNTIVTLQMLKTDRDILKVTYFHEPLPLYERVRSTFSYTSEELEDGDVVVTFKKK